MIFGLCPQILEDRLLPIAFHVIPVINLSMSNRVIDSIAWGFRVRERLVADEEVEIFDTALGRQVPRLGRDCWTASGGLGCGAARGYRGGEDAGCAAG